MRLLRPCETAGSLEAIDYARLYAAGKRAILFDLDNTLGKRRSNELAPRVERLLGALARMGFRVGILTNRRWVRNDPVIEALSAAYPLRHRAGKPGKKGFLDLLTELDVPPERAVMIGDRILTDIIGANRLGIYSIRIQSG